MLVGRRALLCPDLLNEVMDIRAAPRASREATSNQLNDPPLSIGMRFDVALGGRKRCMSSQEVFSKG